MNIFFSASLAFLDQGACDQSCPRSQSFILGHPFELWGKGKSTFCWGSKKSRDLSRVQQLIVSRSFADEDGQEETRGFVPSCRLVQRGQHPSLFWWRIFERENESVLHCDFLWAPKSSSSLFHRVAFLDETSRTKHEFFVFFLSPSAIVFAVWLHFAGHDAFFRRKFEFIMRFKSNTLTINCSSKVLQHFLPSNESRLQKNKVLPWKPLFGSFWKTYQPVENQSKFESNRVLPQSN